MKTKEQILEHFKTTGYEREDAPKIIGYLLGVGILEKGEVVSFRDGNLDFDDFFGWVNEEPKKNKFADIAANLDYLLGFINRKIPTDIKEKTMENVQFLMNNKDYLQDCMDNKEKSEHLLSDVNDILSGLDKGLKSIFSK